MEGLKTVPGRSFIAAGILIVAGVAIQLTPQTVLASKTEKWMEEKAPTKVGNFTFQPSGENPNQSYKVDERTYDILKPFGVVGRVYQDGIRGFDVMLIAGNNKNSFHDNRVCFSGQGWTMKEQEDFTIVTVRGKIPVTLLNLSHQQRGDTMAAFFYKGPHDKFYPLPQMLTGALFFEQLKSSKNLDSVFYRFIPQHPGATKEELIKFIQDYMKEAKATSDGFY
jgi:hypothetical protein